MGGFRAVLALDRERFVAPFSSLFICDFVPLRDRPPACTDDFLEASARDILLPRGFFSEASAVCVVRFAFEFPLFRLGFSSRLIS